MGRARQAYAAAFRDYGIDLAAAAPTAAAARIRDSGIREQLVAALDDWNWNHDCSLLSFAAAHIGTAFMTPDAAARERQQLKALDPEADAVSLERLRAVANLADDDAWRRRLRSVPALAISPKDRPQLEALAGEREAAALPPATALLLGRALFKARAHEKSLAILYAAQQRHPADLRLNFELARLLRYGTPTQGEWEKAAGFTRSALALRPQSPALHLQLGQCLMKTGEPDLAVAEFRHALQLQPDHARAYFELGRAHARKGARNDALQAFTKALESKPDWFQPYHVRGRLYGEQARWDLAAADYDRAAALHTLFPLERWCEHAGVLLLAGKDQAFRGLAIRVVERGQKGVASVERRGAASDRRFACLVVRTAALGPSSGAKPDEVLALARYALAADPANPEYLHALGMAHLRGANFPRRSSASKLRRRCDPPGRPTSSTGSACPWLISGWAKPKTPNNGSTIPHDGSPRPRRNHRTRRSPRSPAFPCVIGLRVISCGAKPRRC